MKKMKIEIITFMVVYAVVAFIHHENWQQLVFHAGGMAVCYAFIVKLLKFFYYDYACNKIAKELLTSNNLTQDQRAFCEKAIASVNNNLSTYQQLSALNNREQADNFLTGLQNIIIYILLFLLSVFVYVMLFLIIAYFYF